MTYPTQPGQPGGWPDQSWPSPEQPYVDPAAQASPAAYDPYSAPPGYSQPSYTQPPPGYVQPQPYAMYNPPSTNGMAIAALVCSITGLITCGITSIVGAILGHIARKQIAERGEGGDGLALAGIIIGWIVFGLTMLGVLFYIGFFALIFSNVDTTSGTTGDGWEDTLRLWFAAAR